MNIFKGILTRKINALQLTQNFSTITKIRYSQKCESSGGATFSPECENALNDQILAEFNAAYAYLSMSAFFGRSTVALPGCEGFFMAMHQEEMDHGKKLMQYQNMRGGKVRLFQINPSENSEWNMLKSMETGLEMEKLIKSKLVKLSQVAGKAKDLSFEDFIITDFINEQDKSIEEFQRLISRYESMKCSGCCGCVDFLFDKEVHRSFVVHAGKDNVYK